jgi:hypothetical protein
MHLVFKVIRIVVSYLPEARGEGMEQGFRAALLL